MEIAKRKDFERIGRLCSETVRKPENSYSYSKNGCFKLLKPEKNRLLQPINLKSKKRETSNPLSLNMSLSSLDSVSKHSESGYN